MKTHALLPILALISVLSPISPAFAQNAAPAELPDVLIFVDARKVGANAVSITYPKVITRTRAEADLSNLLRETGWSAASVNITEGSVMKTGEFPMTAVEFLTPSAIQNDGVIPIEAIVKAFRNKAYIEVQYLMSPTTYVSALGSFENKYVKIRLNRGNNAYRYSIRIKDSGFQDLGLPKAPPEAKAGSSTAEQRTDIRLITTVLIIVLALMAAMLAYIFTSRVIRHRNDRARNVGGQTRRS